MTATIVALTKPYLQLVASRDGRCSRPLYRVEIVHPDNTRHLRDWSWDYDEAVLHSGWSCDASPRRCSSAERYRGKPMEGFWPGILGGFLAWIGTTFLAQPLVAFLHLRAGVARLLVLSEHQHWRMLMSQVSPSENTYGEETCSAAMQLQTFVATNHMFVSYLLAPLGFDLPRASEGLLQLAISNAGSPAESLRQQIARALRIQLAVHPRG